MNPHARAWVALHPDSELIPVARANGVTTVLSAPAGRARLGPERSRAARRDDARRDGREGAGRAPRGLPERPARRSTWRASSTSRS